MKRGGGSVRVQEPMSQGGGPCDRFGCSHINQRMASTNFGMAQPEPRVESICEAHLSTAQHRRLNLTTPPPPQNIFHLVLGGIKGGNSSDRSFLGLSCNITKPWHFDRCVVLFDTA